MRGAEEHLDLLIEALGRGELELVRSTSWQPMAQGADGELYPSIEAQHTFIVRRVLEAVAVGALRTADTERPGPPGSFSPDAGGTFGPMAITKHRVYGPGGAASVRSAVTAADAATWTPDDEGVPDDFILDAREWEDVRLMASYVGSPTGETVTVQLLRSVWVAGGPRQWTAVGSAVVVGAHGVSALFPVDGRDVAWRVTSLTLGGATNVGLVASGGQRRR